MITMIYFILFLQKKTINESTKELETTIVNNTKQSNQFTTNNERGQLCLK